MEKLIKTGRIFYGLAMTGVGIQQLFYGQFCLMLFPSWPAHHFFFTVLAYLGSIVLAAAGVAIVVNWNAKKVSLVLGGCLFALFCFSYAPYEFLFDYYKHLGSWTNALKELALAGGAFVISGSYPKEEHNKSPLVTNVLEKLVPFGPWFFSTTMICFGIAHFLYTQYVTPLVPAWIPYPTFWTYFAGVALIGSGVAIVLRIRVKAIANLLGLMIFLWLLILHIPRAIAEPFMDRGNEITSAFSALAFSGIALVIANDVPRLPLKIYGFSG